MQKFDQLRAVAAPMFESNIDTDQLCPKQHLSAIRKVGFGTALFSDKRLRPDGSLAPDFALNRPEYASAGILIGGENFGCGSSREHAVWALADAGIRCLIAPSYGDIFLQNTTNNGVLAIILPEAQVRDLALKAEQEAGRHWTVDLQRDAITLASGEVVNFSVDPVRKDRLLLGLDEIALTLRHSDALADFEARQQQAEPWLWTRG